MALRRQRLPVGPPHPQHQLGMDRGVGLHVGPHHRAFDTGLRRRRLPHRGVRYSGRRPLDDRRDRAGDHRHRHRHEHDRPPCPQAHDRREHHLRDRRLGGPRHRAAAVLPREPVLGPAGRAARRERLGGGADAAGHRLHRVGLRRIRGGRLHRRGGRRPRTQRAKGHHPRPAQRRADRHVLQRRTDSRDSEPEPGAHRAERRSGRRHPAWPLRRRHRQAAADHVRDRLHLQLPCRAGRGLAVHLGRRARPQPARGGFPWQARGIRAHADQRGGADRRGRRRAGAAGGVEPVQHPGQLHGHRVLHRVRHSGGRRGHRPPHRYVAPRRVQPRPLGRTHHVLRGGVDHPADRQRGMAAHSTRAALVHQLEHGADHRWARARRRRALPATEEPDHRPCRTTPFGGEHKDAG